MHCKCGRVDQARLLFESSDGLDGISSIPTLSSVCVQVDKL